MTIDIRRIQRYRSQSLRFLDSAMTEMRSGRWLQAEELLWGSLTLALKGVALSRGEHLEDDTQVKVYAARLGQEYHDRRLREAFNQLVAFGDGVDRIRESRSRVDHLFVVLDDVSSAVKRLWEMVPAGDEH
jgi:uncharacterized protein with von Willebrand factor type A (vWA) domain